MQKITPFLCLVLLSIAARGGVIEPAAAIVRFPTTITRAGTYVVASNLILKGTSGNGITVNADNVTIDLNEHTLTNEIPTADGTVTKADCINVTNFNNVTVRNGTITGFATGVFTESGTVPGLTTVANVTFNQCSNAGVNLSGDVVEVRDCRTSGCGQFGLVINDSNYATMSGNHVFNTTGGAFGLSNCRGLEAIANDSCTMVNNNVVNTTSTLGEIGIAIFCQFGLSFARDNFVANWSNGVQFANGSLGKYLDNLTDNCTTPFSGGTAVTGNN